ncbi:MAG: cytochrome c3 family protein [Pelobacteraceae bacterium]
MSTIFTGFIFCLLLTAPLQAANVITFGKDSSIVFPHKQHQSTLGGCTECHGDKDPGPIAQFGEQWAHATCTGCHSENKAGPVECSGCHSQI